MPRTLALLALSLFCLRAQAADVDPLCRNEHGIRSMNPLASDPLQVVKGCIPLYCDPQVADSGEKDGIKHIDGKFGEMAVANSLMATAIQKFIKACRALSGDLTQVGPKMDAMVASANELEFRRQNVSTLYHGAQNDPEAGIYSQTAMRATRDFKQPNCTNQINTRLVDLLNQSQQLLDRSDINCANPDSK
ncbi:MAG: hypothetical protein ACXVB9_19510 [Bdellovibrionota bacterium]